MAGGIALIQGASRGIGLQFCRSLLQSRPGVKVIGTCRDPNAAHQLQTLKVEFPGALTVLSLDVTKPEDLLRAAENVQRDFPCLDLLINCTAMLHPSGRGETSLREVTAEGLSHTFATNTIGPLLMVKHFSPLLLKGTGAFGPDLLTRPKSTELF
ncbi:hypothetical protein GDO86_013173 [Hymenochirus boettgeri]|uniref:Uncharacterized protein n=1 Tax=Hymenochirus boettgeri TaxID=247094 RepID=A0A8T2IVP1_9PIPI|nr:hypothetical protein GDO86_013173 [Hymenochirus boettgeri]